MSEESNSSKGPNLNTAIISIGTAIILGAIGWVGKKTSDTGDSLIRMEATLPFVAQTVTELKAQIANMVTRSELDSRTAELRAANAALEKRVLVIEISRGKEKSEP